MMSQDLKFNYKTKYLKSILILGIMYVILGVLSIFLIEESNFLTVLIFFGFNLCIPMEIERLCFSK